MLNPVPPDTWSVKEQLCLATAVLRNGDQNWVLVARQMKSFSDEERPHDWFSQKNCALQYDMLLETIAQPKRKRGDKGDLIEKPGEEILKKLKDTRISELSKIIEENGKRMAKYEADIALLKDSSISEDTIDRIEKDANKDEEDEAKRQMSLSALMEKSKLIRDSQRSRSSSSRHLSAIHVEQEVAEDDKPIDVKEEKKPSATELSSPLLSSLLKAPSNVSLQPILAQQVESRTNLDAHVEPKSETDNRILLVDANDVDIDDVEEIEPDLSPEAQLKSPRETLQNCGELTESQGSSDEANVVSETEISSQISESILDEEKDCINKSLVEEIGYSTESNASDASTEHGSVPENEDAKSVNDADSTTKIDADRSMSIESLTCIEVEVSPIHEEEIVSVGISEEEDKEEESQTSNRMFDFDDRMSGDHRRSARNSTRKGRTSEGVDDENPSLKRDSRGKKISEDSEDGFVVSSNINETSLEESQTQPVVTPGVTRGSRRSIVKKVIQSHETSDETAKDDMESLLANAPENKRVNRVKDQEGPMPSKTRRGSGGTQTTSRSSSPVPSGEESESDNQTPRNRPRRKSTSGTDETSNFKITEEWQKLALKMLEDVKKHKLFIMIAEKGKTDEQASHEPRNFDLLSTNITSGVIKNVQTFQAEFLLVLVNIIFTYKAEELSGLVKNVCQNFYETLGSLVDTPLQEKISSIKLSNSSSRSRRKEDEPLSKAGKVEKQESTPLSSTPGEERRKRSAPSDEAQVPASSNKKRKR